MLAADLYHDRLFVAAVEHVGDEGRSAKDGRGTPKSRSWRKSRSASLLIPWKRLSIESRICRPSGSLRRNETGRVAIAVDREDVGKPVPASPSRLSAERHASVIVGPAPP